MGRVRVGLVVLVLALASLSASFPGDPGAAAYGAGDSIYEPADPGYDTVAWTDPQSPDPGSASCSAGTVALTFDDGPGPYTSRVLDLLATYRVRATFFVVGERV